MIPNIRNTLYSSLFMKSKYYMEPLSHYETFSFDRINDNKISYIESFILTNQTDTYKGLFLWKKNMSNIIITSNNSTKQYKEFINFKENKEIDKYMLSINNYKVKLINLDGLKKLTYFQKDCSCCRWI